MILKEALPEDLEAMSDLFEHQGYKTLRKVLNNKIISLGEAALNAENMEQVSEYKGFKEGIQFVDSLLKAAHLKKEKNSRDESQFVSAP